MNKQELIQLHKVAQEIHDYKNKKVPEEYESKEFTIKDTKQEHIQAIIMLLENLQDDQ